MTDSEPGYNKETAAAAKAALEERLNDGETLTGERMRKDAAAYLEVERGIFRSDNPINPNCQHIPPWERTAGQILRDVNDIEKYTPDETGLCRRFVAEAAGWFAWNESESKWYVWAGTHWTNEKAELLALKTTEYLKEQIGYEKPANMILTTDMERGKQILTIKVNRDWREISKAAAKIHTREQIVKMARADFAAKFDTDRRIPFNNGMFDPATGVLEPHSPGNHNTTVCPYDLNLTAPRFKEGEEFIKQISCEDSEWEKALWRILGECLLYGNPSQFFCVFYGSGGNGKGVLVDWITKAMGNLAASVSPREISRNNPDGRQTTLYDTVSRCRYLFFKEAGNIQYDDDMMQALTGERTIELTRIMKGSKTLEVCGTPILITNNMPSVEKGGYSMQRRQIGLPFDFRIDPTKRDQHLYERLTTREGCEWLICQITKALIESQKPGQQNLFAAMPDRVKRFTETLTTEADIVLQFLNECCIVAPAGPARTSRADLYQSFCGYAYSPQGMNPTPNPKYRISVKTFADRLRGYDYIPLDNKQRTTDGKICRYVYPGISLNQTGEEYYNIESGGWYA